MYTFYMGQRNLIGKKDVKPDNYVFLIEFDCVNILTGRREYILYNTIVDDIKNGKGYKYKDIYLDLDSYLVLNYIPRILTSNELKLLMFNSNVYKDSYDILCFKTSGLLTGKIPEGVEALEKTDEVTNVNINKLNFPDSIRYLRPQCLLHSLIESVNFGKNLSFIDEEAFKDSIRLKSLDFRNTNLYEIYTGAFSGCLTLFQVHFSNKLHRIHSKAFSDCNIRSLVFPESLANLDSDCFYGNTCLERIEFLGVSEVSRSFMDCYNIKEIIVHKELIIWDCGFGEVLEDDYTAETDEVRNILFYKRKLTRGIYHLVTIDEELHLRFKREL